MGKLLKTQKSRENGKLIITDFYDNTYYVVIPGFSYTEKGPIQIDKIKVKAHQNNILLIPKYYDYALRCGRSKKFGGYNKSRYGNVDASDPSLVFPFSQQIRNKSLSSSDRQIEIPFNYFYDNVDENGLHILTPYNTATYFSEDNNEYEHDGLFAFEIKSLSDPVLINIEYYTYTGQLVKNDNFPNTDEYLLIKSEQIEYYPSSVYNINLIVPANFVRQKMYTDQADQFIYYVELNKILLYNSNTKKYCFYNPQTFKYEDSDISTETGDHEFFKLRRFVYPFWSVKNYGTPQATEWGAMFEEGLILHSAVYNDYIMPMSRRGKTKTSGIKKWILNSLRTDAFAIQLRYFDKLKLFNKYSFLDLFDYGIYRPNGVDECWGGIGSVSTTLSTYLNTDVEYPRSAVYELYDDREGTTYSGLRKSVDWGIEGAIKKGVWKYTYDEDHPDKNIYEQFGETFDTPESGRYSAKDAHFTTVSQIDTDWTGRNNEYGTNHGVTTGLDAWRFFEDQMKVLGYPVAISTHNEACVLNTNFNTTLNIANYKYSSDYLYINRPKVRLQNVSSHPSLLILAIWDHKEKNNRLFINIILSIDTGDGIPTQLSWEHDYGADGRLYSSQCMQSNRSQNELSPRKEVKLSNAWVLNPNFDQNFYIGKRLIISINHNIDVNIPKNYRVGSAAKAAAFIPNALMLVDTYRSELRYDNESDYSVIPQYYTDLGYSENNLVDLNVAADYITETRNYAIDGESQAVDFPFKSSFLDPSYKCWGKLKKTVKINHDVLKANTVYAFHINYLAKTDAGIITKIVLTDNSGTQLVSGDSGKDVIIFKIGQNDIPAGTFMLEFQVSGNMPDGYIQNFGIYEVLKVPKQLSNSFLLGNPINGLQPELLENASKYVVFPTTFCYIEDGGCFNNEFFSAQLPSTPIRRIGGFYKLKNTLNGMNATDYPAYVNDWEFMLNNPCIRKQH